MARQKARKTKARDGVKNLSAKTLSVHEARGVRGGDDKKTTTTTSTTKKTDKYLVVTIESTLIT